LFGNTACETRGEPTEAELALLTPFKTSLPPATLGPMAQPPRTDTGDGLRGNLRRAQKLLADAGWTVRDGALRNASGEPMVLEYLDSSESGVKIVSSWMRNLEKLGITLKVRNVDYALYQQRMDKYDFDIVTLNVPGTHNRVRNMPSCLAAPLPMEGAPTMSGSRASGCHHRPDGGGQVRAADAARLPCAGAHHRARPLPDSPVLLGHAPDGL
jgi:microcin C transport system substrate-binding protein